MPASKLHFALSPLAMGLAATLLSGVGFAATPADVSNFTVISGPLNGSGFTPVRVVANPSGEFAMAYTDAFGLLGLDYVQVFAADGTPLGSPVAVAAITGSPVYLATSKNGDFVASWTERPNDFKTELQFQRFGADGVPKGSVVNVATVPNYNYFLTGFGLYTANTTGPLVAMDDDGDVAVAWNARKTNDVGCVAYVCLSIGESSANYVAVYKADNSVKTAATSVDSVPYKLFYGKAKNTPYGDNLLDIAMEGNGNVVLAITHPVNGTATVSALRCSADLSSIAAPQVIANIANLIGFGVDTAGNAIAGLVSPDYTQANIYRVDPRGNALGSSTYTVSDSSVYGIESVKVSASGKVAVEVLSTTQADFFGSGVQYQDYHFWAQYYNADGSIDGSLMAIDNDSADFNNIVTTDGASGSVMTSAIDSNSRLVSVWQAILSDQVTAALLGSQISAP